MRPHKYSTEGIILARKNYGEADRILSIYTKDHGRIAVLAKGVRRPKSRKRGHLEIFSHIKFELSDNGNLGLMTEAVTDYDFSGIRSDLNKIALSYYVMEVVGKITHDQEKNVELFDLVLSTLHQIEKGSGLKKQRQVFINKILVLLGYWPEGKVLADPDSVLEDVIERRIASARVGKRMLQ